MFFSAKIRKSTQAHLFKQGLFCILWGVGTVLSSWIVTKHLHISEHGYEVFLAIPLCLCLMGVLQGLIFMVKGWKFIIWAVLPSIVFGCLFCVVGGLLLIWVNYFLDLGRGSGMLMAGLFILGMGVYSGIFLGLIGLVIGWGQSYLLRPVPRGRWMIGFTGLAYGISWQSVLSHTIDIQFVDYVPPPPVDAVGMIQAIHHAGVQMAIIQGIGLFLILSKPPKAKMTHDSSEH